MCDEKKNVLIQYGPRYPWNSFDQSTLLGIYYIGYAAVSIPMGLIIDRFGFVKHYFTMIILLVILSGALAPVAAAESFGSMVALRLILGIASVG